MHTRPTNHIQGLGFHGPGCEVKGCKLQQGPEDGEHTAQAGLIKPRIIAINCARYSEFCQVLPPDPGESQGAVASEAVKRRCPAEPVFLDLISKRVFVLTQSSVFILIKWMQRRNLTQTTQTPWLTDVNERHATWLGD